MKYLTGKDYPYLCNGCRAAIDSMSALGIDEEYRDDPEALLAMAGDRGLLYSCPQCVGSDGSSDPPEDKIGFDHPRWSIFLVSRSFSSKTIAVVPICTAFDIWPVHGGTYTDIAEGLGFEPERDKDSPVGGVYYHPILDISLHCLRYGEWPSGYEGWCVISPVLKNADLVWP